MANQRGFTLVELLISMVVIGIISVGFFSLYTSLISSSVLAKQRAVAGMLASNQIEYLRSLPYDNLAVSGGNIISNSYIAGTVTKRINGTNFTVVTSIVYADDAYDGCGPYPTLDLKKKYCRNFLAPGNSGNNSASDQNPADYKLAHVIVKNPGGAQLAVLDTQIAARVAETASATGALFITVTDPSGAAVPDANVRIANSTVSPAVNGVGISDNNGLVIFYGVPPDNGLDYIVSVDKPGYSSINSLRPSGSLQPTYSNLKVLSQQSSYLAVVIAPMRSESLIIEATDLTGTPLSGLKVYVKGGYKKYTLASNTAYYFDNLNPIDTRSVTDAAGITTLDNLPPVNEYFFCGDNGSQDCTIGGVTYYLVAALPYGGKNSLAPIAVPAANDNEVSSFTIGSTTYRQKVRLLLTTNSLFPRLSDISPNSINTSDNLHSVKVVFTGYNLINSTATLSKDGVGYTDNNCISNATQLTCNYDLSGVTPGDMQVKIRNSSGTVILPTAPKGGIYVGS